MIDMLEVRRGKLSSAYTSLLANSFSRECRCYLNFEWWILNCEWDFARANTLNLMSRMRELRETLFRIA
jgi:hypothetical protein